MSTTIPLSHRLENLIATDFKAALEAEDALNAEDDLTEDELTEDELKGNSSRHNAEWKARMGKYPIRVFLDKVCMDATFNRTRPNPVSHFITGMQLSFGAFIAIAEQLAAKGDPALLAALKQLDRREFKDDLTELQKITMNNLVPWRGQYPPFLLAFRTSLHFHREAKKRPVAKLHLYDGIFAMVTWVVHAITRMDKANKAN